MLETHSSSSNDTRHRAQLTRIGSTALITGAGRGLGAELSLTLARRGLRVVGVARSEADLAALARRAHDEGLVLHTHAADIGDKLQTHAIAGSAAALVGPIDLLIHNASTLGHVPLQQLIDTDCETIEDTLRVNLLGAFRLSKVIVGSMVLRRRGTLVHISSDAAVEAYPSWGPYGLSKAALDHLSRTWAAELDGTGVRSLSIDPGEMDTRMHADAIPDADRSTLASPVDVADQIARLLEDPLVTSGARVAASRWSTP